MFISCLTCAHIIVFALFICSTQINFTVAIDFTASNGELTSLKHCLQKKKHNLHVMIMAYFMCSCKFTNSYLL